MVPKAVGMRPGRNPLQENWQKNAWQRNGKRELGRKMVGRKMEKEGKERRLNWQKGEGNRKMAKR
jgi:hypothetical protein